MNNVYVSGQERYDLMLPDDEEISIPEDFLDFILYDELRLDKLPLHLVESVANSILSNREFTTYLNNRYQEHLENDIDI